MMYLNKHRSMVVRWIWLSFVLFITLASSLSQAQRLENDIPPILQPWQEWVQWDTEFLDCPVSAGGQWGSKASHICSWPGLLALDLDDRGGKFSLHWSLQTPSRVTLPGTQAFRPLNVLVNNESIAVGFDGAVSSIYLEAGEYQVTGDYQWTSLPETLYLPSQLALFELSLNGERVTAPRFAESNANELLLQAAQQVGESQEHRLNISRLIFDGIPTRMNIFLDIFVSGSAREINLGRILPDGFYPTGYNGELPMRIDQQGNAILFVRPGDWELGLYARASTMLDNITLPESPTTDATEVWSFANDVNLRTVRVEGITAIDASFFYVPWTQSYPTYQVSPGDSLQLIQLERGLSETPQSDINLSRYLWLAHDGKSWSATDSLGGVRPGLDRVELGFGWELQFANETLDGESTALLISRLEVGLDEQPMDQNPGVEIRSELVQVDAGLSSLRQGSSLVANGWSEPMQSIEMYLQLGPGYRLFATQGVDQDTNSWVVQWELLDWFILLLLVLAGFYAAGYIGALLSLLTGLLIWQQLPGLIIGLLILWIILIIKKEFLHEKVQQTLAVITGVVLAILVIYFIPFAGSEITYSMYPQLHDDAPVSSSNRGVETVNSTMQWEQPEAIVSESYTTSSQADEDSAELQRVSVTGSRISKKDILGPLPDGLATQAGQATPQWTWYSHYLKMDAEVQPRQEIRLFILSPWQTALWRLSAVLLFLLVLFLAANKAFPNYLLKLKPKASNAALLFLLLAVSGVDNNTYAQAVLPDATMLNALKERLIVPPECAENCTSIERAVIDVMQDAVQISLRVHSLRNESFPLPDSQDLVLQQVSVNGVLMEKVGRFVEPNIPLGVGTHRVNIKYLIPSVDSVTLTFNLLPAQAEVINTGWQISGLRGYQLAGNSLRFDRLQTDADAPAFITSINVTPYAKLQRSITISNDWSVDSTIQRLAPEHGSIVVPIKLLEGESPLATEYELEGRVIQAVYSDDGASENGWGSNLEHFNEMILTADNNGAYSESWSFTIGQQFHVEFSGVPEVAPSNQWGSYQERIFYPLPGEVLTVRISQPIPITTNTIAVDEFRQEDTIGKHARKVDISLLLRNNITQDYQLTLPGDAVLNDVWLDGVSHQQSLSAGVLIVPVSAGSHRLLVSYNQPLGVTTKLQSSHVNMDIPTANIHHKMIMGESRWVLWIGGAGIKPTVLYWSQLVVMLLVVSILVKLNWTPLRFWQWLLIGMGFSTIHWGGALIVVLWLHLISWRQNRSWVGDRGQFQQVAMIVTAIASLFVVITALPKSMLSSPDMHIQGFGSNANQINWFIDKVSSTMPDRWVISLPLWCYQAFILIWALWLAVMLVSWVRWTIGMIDWQGWQSKNIEKEGE